MTRTRLPRFAPRSFCRPTAAFLLLAAALALGGCEVFGFFAGHGSQKALYTLPKGKRVLVLVDVRPETAPPPTFGTMLGDRIASHLYRYKAADALVGQDKLLDLQRDPARYAKMGVEDIAKATGADVVVVVWVPDLLVTQSTDQGITHGGARATVKVVDSSGTRLWPGDLAGEKVEAQISPALTSEKDKTAVYNELAEQLTVRVGRMFHAYDLEDKTMTKTPSGERL
jgi:hypothetical protein